MIITVPMARTLKNNIERNIFKKKLLKGEKYEKLQPQDVIFSKEISDGTETIKLDVLRTNGFTTVDGDLVVISNAYKKEDGERVSKIKLTTKYFKKFHKSLDEILGELKKLGIANSSMDLQESTLKNILNEEKSIEKKEEEL
uniref:Uncharacterized protein n=1 Tax=Acrobeloides nanus TaxID=290746 RepID=A0A914DGV5_9BILA